MATDAERQTNFRASMAFDHSPEHRKEPKNPTRYWACGHVTSLDFVGNRMREPHQVVGEFVFSLTIQSGFIHFDACP